MHSRCNSFVKILFLSFQKKNSIRSFNLFTKLQVILIQIIFGFS